MKEVFSKCIEEAGSICILGHVHPDGDCVGSVLGIMNYLLVRWPSKEVAAYLEEPQEKFSYLKGFESILFEASKEKSYDLCIVLDCGDIARTGRFAGLLKNAASSFLVDHHITNEGFCTNNVIEPHASSTSEIIWTLMDEDLIDRDIAACIYTGIVHDTGIFKYSCTSQRTMEIAGKCIAKGVDFGKIIDDSFCFMSFEQRRLLGRVFEDMKRTEDGLFVYATLDQKTMKEYGVTNSKETDGFVGCLRETEGALGAAFVYQVSDMTYKASLRSNTERLNVAEIAVKHSGGGHKMAAGCFLGNDPEGGLSDILKEVAGQLGAG